MPNNKSILILSSSTIIAWIITFVGACVFRKGLSGGAWWIVIYELLLIMTTIFILINNVFTQYRLMLLTFLAASVAMSTYQLDYALPVSKFASGYRSGASAYATGYILLLIAQVIYIYIYMFYLILIIHLITTKIISCSFFGSFY
ncbi:uncharacterized protein BX663DRAFT_299113 [Cokeromyces recurvatus]|uniref:uncharacterized protein n=1 Tax=Cokeromyces recurvatus TaxID=90255 RepID=UPI00221EC157|nr:uncharacterized protein BX663DRAFT_299113 [Cokeromyces recurvatus]KAI7897673.1 hypothetical protein BX663DRAFT_299113 [Cokeromyces recurvatus]